MFPKSPFTPAKKERRSCDLNGVDDYVQPKATDLRPLFAGNGD